LKKQFFWIYGNVPQWTGHYHARYSCRNTVGDDIAGSTAGVTLTDNLDGTETITLTTPKGTDAKKFARLKVIVD
jgi:hypothetical protein